MGNVSDVVNGYSDEDDDTNWLDDAEGPIVEMYHCHHLEDDGADGIGWKNADDDVLGRDEEHEEGEKEAEDYSLLGVAHYDLVEFNPGPNIVRWQEEL